MAKITRVYHRLFGASAGATDVGQFGSFASGSPTYSKNADTIMALANWAAGWLSAAVGANNNPFLEDRNAVDLVHSQQIGYLLQQGIAEWDAQTPYYTGSFCTYGGVPYTSITDNNVGNNPPASPANWTPYDSTRVGVILPFAGIVLPYGYGLCDGSAESRAGRPALFASLTLSTTGSTVNGSNIISAVASTAGMVVGFNVSGPGIPAGAKIGQIDGPTQFRTVNAAGAALNATATAAGVAIVVSPHGLGDGTTTFNRPDYRGRTLIGAGTGAGLTARTIGQTLGEETHTLTTAELASHAHGGITGDDSPDHAHYENHGFGGAFYARSDGGSGGTYLADGGAIYTAGANTRHQHGISAEGGNAAHNNMQPSAVCPFMIKLI